MSSNNSADESLDFPAIVNGVDFLDSAITHLMQQDPRSLKYAVLHLQAAIEILVKVRLQREGIEHIFDDPYRADADKFQNGNFKSVTLDSALQRLEVITDVQLEKTDKVTWGKLAKERNRLQHFGSLASVESVTVHAAEALNVLSDFISQYLITESGDADRLHLDKAQDRIKEAVREVDFVTQARLTRISHELDEWPGPIIHCPDCQQLSWTFEPGNEDSHCRLCQRKWWEEPGYHAAEEYVTNILGESEHLARQGRSGWSISRCPGCHEESLVDVATRDEPHSFLTTACFTCNFFEAGPRGTCEYCGGATLDPAYTICTPCFQYRSSKDD